MKFRYETLVGGVENGSVALIGAASGLICFKP
jgi:hypothetical protein